MERAAEALEAVPCPTVAYLNGGAFGGGFELAATCDLRVAREDVLLGLPPAKLGVVYPEGGLRRFLALVGSARARASSSSSGAPSAPTSRSPGGS